MGQGGIPPLSFTHPHGGTPLITILQSLLRLSRVNPNKALGVGGTEEVLHFSGFKHPRITFLISPSKSLPIFLVSFFRIWARGFCCLFFSFGANYTHHFLILGLGLSPWAGQTLLVTTNASPLPHTRYILLRSHFSRFHHPKIIGRGAQIITLLIMYFSPLSCSFVPLRTKYSPQHSTLKHPQPTFLPQNE